MPLDFHNDAIVLSGRTGTMIKTDVLGVYYDYWHRIVSGGPNKNFEFPCTIVEMNAGTGEIYLEDEKTTILGSAGHALQLKYGSDSEERGKHLNIFLVEESPQCLEKLIKVINRRWPETELEKESFRESYRSQDYTVRIYDSQEKVRVLPTHGNSLVFFDPLRATKWTTIERIAQRRIEKPFKTRTEFLVFLFTSDWIKGRKGFAPLPRTQDPQDWDEVQWTTVQEADEVFEDRKWQDITSSALSDEAMELALVDLYKQKLQKWFRFAIDLPFMPKLNERYDLLCCTNYVDGSKLICGFFKKMVKKYTTSSDHPSLYRPPDASEVYPRFSNLYPKLISRLPNQRRRPIEWKVLWEIVRNHPDGLCDQACRNLLQKYPDKKPAELEKTLAWLEKERFLKKMLVKDWPWSKDSLFPRYIANWSVIQQELEIPKPPRFEPLRPK